MVISSLAVAYVCVYVGLCIPTNFSFISDFEGSLYIDLCIAAKGLAVVQHYDGTVERWRRVGQIVCTAVECQLLGCGSGVRAFLAQFEA